MDSPLTPSIEPALTVQIIGASYYLSPRAMEAILRSFVAALAGAGFDISVTAVSINEQPLPHSRREKLAIQWQQADGSLLDISAYRTGLQSSTPSSAYVMLNDTLFIRHPWRCIARALTTLIPVIAASPVAAAAGEVHPSSDLLLWDAANPTRKHLSTFCFALNPAGQMVFNEILATLPDGGCASTTQDWLASHVLRYPALGSLLYVHLNAPPNPWTWPRRSKVSSVDLLTRKAVTVAVEYLLTARLLERSGIVMPVNMHPGYRLASRLAALLSR